MSTGSVGEAPRLRGEAVPTPGAPNTGTPAKAVYNGKGQMGARLRQMQLDGKRVINQERARLQVNRRMYLGDQYLQVSPVGVRTLAPAALLQSGRRRDTVNRLRQFVDGRVALLTAERPSYSVEPRSLDLDDMAGARTAEAMIAGQWDNDQGWNIAQHMRELGLAGEQDGIAFSSCAYDMATGPLTEQPIPLAPDPTSGRWLPITSRETLEALKLEDPDGGTLWREERVRLGDVVLRVVRLGSLSVDPMLTTDWRRVRWVIESRVLTIDELERLAGRSIDELRRSSDATLGTRSSTTQTPAVSADDGGTADRLMRPGEGVTVHELHHLRTGAGGDWPQGAHVIWAEQAPASPLVQNAYTDDDLPLRPYVPKPDGLHLLRSRGTVDALAPIQVRLNRAWSARGEWLDLLSHPTMIMNGGAIRSQTVSRDGRMILELTPGATPPVIQQIPAPTAAFAEEIRLLVEQMAEIATQSDVTRGTPPGQGVTAGVSLQYLGQQNEQQMQGTASQLKAVLQWALSRALRLVERHYVVPRLVDAPGVDDAEGFAAFTGDKLRGCTDLRVKGSLMPRSRDGQLQALMAITQASGGRFDVSDYLPEFMAGDAASILKRLSSQEARQARENRQMAAMGRHPDRDAIWESFQAQRQAFLEALSAARSSGQDPGAERGRSPGAGPQGALEALSQEGITPPQITAMIGQLRARGSGGVPGLPSSATRAQELPQIPAVEDFDRDPVHLAVLDEWACGDGFGALHPLVQQLTREHRQAHITKQARTMQALTQGAPPRPLALPAGEPAQPAQGAPQ
jgi:hypothetical protein